MIEIGFIVAASVLMYFAHREGRRLGHEEGRHKERLSVIAYLVGAYRSEEQVNPQELAKLIDDSAHTGWGFRKRGR